MRAADLVVVSPTITRATPASEAARILADSDLPGLIVVDDAGAPLLALPGTQTRRMAVPQYCQDDPAPAREVDEAAADAFIRELDCRTVAQRLRGKPIDPPVVGGHATALELATLMACTRSPLVAVTGPGGALAGVVTLHGLLDRVLGENA